MYWEDILMVNDDDKKYVNEVVWKDYSKDDNLEEILVDVVDDMGEYHNTLYKIRTHDEFVVAWVSKDLEIRFPGRMLLLV